VKGYIALINAMLLICSSLLIGMELGAQWGFIALFVLGYLKD
jgi:hypothetical protein